jgi:MFS family permease
MPLDDCTMERMKCAAEAQREAVEEQRREDAVAEGERAEAASRAAEPVAESRPAAPAKQPQPAAEPVVQPRPEGAERRRGAPQAAPLVSGGFGAILHRRDFRLLWSGEFVSLLGDQFFNVALPWLVLQLTGNAFAIGTVVAVTGAPRAVFILIGGALIDRFSPRTVMLYSNIGRMVLVAVLAVITATGLVQLWMLYVFGLLLGLGTALYLPAQSAIIPRLVPASRLQTGNAVIQGTSQLSAFLGPVLAGVLIAFTGQESAGTGTVPQGPGISIALALDAATFLVSAITLWMIKLSPVRRIAPTDGARKGVFRSVGEGLADVWRDKTLRLYFVLIGVVNLALLGPISVGIPVLAATRFSGGAFAYGAILSGLGAGALAGVVAGGALRRPSGRAFAAALLGSVVLLGVGLALLGAVSSTAGAIAAASAIGLAEGYVIVEFITWLQLRTSGEELGRRLSILLFVSVGMAPLSNLIAGSLIQVNATAVMIGAGSLIVLVAVVAAFSPAVWRLSDDGVGAEGG